MMHENGKLLFVKYAVPTIATGAAVLEIGPSRRRHDLREAIPEARYHYADIRNFGIGPGRVRMKDGYAIECDDNAFDCVFAAQVVEHVANPFRWIAELKRVARKTVIVIAPVSFEYHCPPDHWRIFAEGMRALFDSANMKTVLAVTESLDGKHTDTIGIAEK